MKYMNNLIWLQFYLEQYAMLWMILHKIRLSVRLEKFRVSIAVLKKNKGEATSMVQKISIYLKIQPLIYSTHKFQCMKENNAYWKILSIAWCCSSSLFFYINNSISPNQSDILSIAYSYYVIRYYWFIELLN